MGKLADSQQSYNMASLLYSKPYVYVIHSLVSWNVYLLKAVL